jgi:hypothetical protein
MVAMGQATYSLPLDTFDVSRTIPRFVELEANHERVAAELADHVGRARRRLDGLLDPVFGPRVGAPGAVPTPAAARGEGVAVPRPGRSPEPT